VRNIPKIELILEELDCANCAKKIEDKIMNLEGVRSAYIDFASGKLIIEGNENDSDRITGKAIEIVKSIEPGVEVIDEDKDQTGHQREHVSGFDDRRNKKELIRLFTGAVFFITAIAFKLSLRIEFIMYLISYVIIGSKIILRSARNILKGEVFDENFLVSIATLGAFAIKESPEGVAVMLFYQIGEFMQNLAVNRSRKSIAALMNIKPDFANLKVSNGIKKVSPEKVNVGDIILVKPGEKIPLDGKVIEGKSFVNTSALTGEPTPRGVETGNEVLSGFINKTSVLTIEVTKEFRESTVAKILDLVEYASSKKAPTEKFITRFAKYYTPVIVFSALALAVIPPLIIQGATFSEWIYRALIFLVVSCPCALVISIPLGFFGGIGGASRNGILVKGGNYLEALNNVDTVVFDKTGTLTKGVFEVTQINPREDMSNDVLLEYTAFAESYSNHPIATSILKAYKKDVNKNEIESYDELPGYGIKAKVRGQEILVGNAKLMNKEKIDFDETETADTVIYVAIDGKYTGDIIISDRIKEDAKETIKTLKSIGVKKTVMLTGDNETVGTEVARQLGVDEVYAELLPNQKVEQVEMLYKQKGHNGKLIFVGDGINDAPVLARADIGVAMGGLGSDAAIEAADVVLMTDEPCKLATAIKIAKRTRSIVWQNIIFALGVKGVVLLLGAGGIATMWEAVFADVGVAIIAVLNAMRAIKVENIR